VPLLPAGLSRSGKTAGTGIKFTHVPKISIFAPQGRLAAPIHVKFGTAEGHAGPLAVQNFTPIGARGGNAAPKWQKFPLFGKESTDLYFC